jgi:hypothetical protein
MQFGHPQEYLTRLPRRGEKRERKFKSVCAPQCAPLLTLSFLPKTAIVPVFENREQLPKERLPFFQGFDFIKKVREMK